MALSRYNGPVLCNHLMNYTRDNGNADAAPPERIMLPLEHNLIAPTSIERKEQRRIANLFTAIRYLVENSLVCTRHRTPLDNLSMSLKDTGIPDQIELRSMNLNLRSEVNRLLSSGALQLKQVRRCENCQILLQHNDTNGVNPSNKVEAVLRYLMRPREMTRGCTANTGDPCGSPDKVTYCRQWLQTHASPPDGEGKYAGQMRTGVDLMRSEDYVLRPQDIDETNGVPDGSNIHLYSRNAPHLNTNHDVSRNFPHHVPRVIMSKFIQPRRTFVPKDYASNGSSPASEGWDTSGIVNPRNFESPLIYTPTRLRFDSQLFPALSSIDLLLADKQSNRCSHRNSETLRFLSSMSPKMNFIPPPNLNPFAKNKSI